MPQTAASNASQNLVINVSYDASAAAAPAGFRSAVGAAASYLEAAIASPVSININVGWGEVGGTSLEPGALGQSSYSGDYYSYDAVKAALAAGVTSADDTAALATLPASDPTGGGSFFVSSAQAKALGLATGASSASDGSVGLASDVACTFDPTHRSVPGAYDAIGALEHEMTEVMGRSGSLGMWSGSGVYTPLDLFRYAAPGLRDLASGPGYFSVDGSQMLLAYNDPGQGGDPADWDTATLGDAFGDGMQGAASLVSATDLREMDVIGYRLATPANTASLPAAGMFAAASPTPVISHAAGGQLVNDRASLAPFAAVVISDPATGQTETVTVTLGTSTRGSLSTQGQGTVDASGGVYIVSGSAAAVTAAVDAVVFTPAGDLARDTPSTAEFTIAVTDTAGRTATDATTSVTIRATAATNDFNATGVSDVLFADAASGALLSWQVSNGVYGGSTAIASAAAGWTAIGTGDFNGDGATDILFQNAGSGLLLDWQMNGGTFAKSVAIAGAAAGWREVGTGDFNGDGTTDVLFQNTASGLLLDWQMKDGTFSSAISIAGAAAGWGVAGTDDFNGDGTTDILFQNVGSGLLLDWQMGQGGFVKSIPIAGAAAGWHVAGTGDFNGDGTTDILFQNDQSGLVLSWEMTDGMLSKSVAIAGASADWKLVGTGDYNGDGTTDILFQNRSGLLLYWQMHDGQFVKSVPLAGATADWQVRA